MDVNQVRNLINSERPKFIKQAQKYAEDLSVHSSGERINAFLAKINKYENIDQAKLRKKFSISNKHKLSNLLNPVENVWSARGGSVYSNLNDSQTKQLNEALKTLAGGKTFDEYMKTIYFDALVGDPNGMTMLYFDEDTPQLKQIASCDVISYEMWGDSVKWILFEPEEDEKGHKYYTYIDNDIYQVWKESNGNLHLYDDEVNIMGFVPIIFNGVYFGKPNIREDKKEFARLSPIDSELQLLQSYIRKNSVKEIYEFLHAYPKFWKYVMDCPTCAGYGHINDEQGNKIQCPKCQGIGFMDRTDVSDVYGLSLPTGDDTKIAPDVMGYVQPDLETWKEMRTELDWDWEQIFQSHWNTQYEKSTNETATGRFIDVQPVNARLTKYSWEIETVYNKLIDMLLLMMFPESTPEYKKYFGKQFIIETADQALRTYKESKDSPEIVRNSLLNQLVLSEYKSDQIAAERHLNMLKIEPFVHHTFEEVEKLTINSDDKLRKYYFNEWVMTLDKVDEPIEKLRESFNKYVELKIKDNET